MTGAEQTKRIQQLEYQVYVLNVSLHDLYRVLLAADTNTAGGVSQMRSKLFPLQQQLPSPRIPR